SNPPLSQKDRILVVPALHMQQWQRETITTVDTLYRNDSIILDSTVTETPIVGNSNNYSSSSLGYDFIKEHLVTMKSPEMVSAFVRGKQIEVYPNNTRMQLSVNLVDARYWDIFDFEFIEGQAFDPSAVENQSRVVVLTGETAREYFGSQDSYVDREMVRGS